MEKTAEKQNEKQNVKQNEKVETNFKEKRAMLEQVLLGK